MNHNPQSSEGRHDDDVALSDFLASLMDYTPTIPDELVEHYLAKSGFQCPDVRLWNMFVSAGPLLFERIRMSEILCKLVSYEEPCFVLSFVIDLTRENGARVSCSNGV
ncbi:putative transcription initiation factor TFIID, 23-30kDa subunit [Lupinus albus]|uniref:Putative transcription initiation factor TFIID, 23-30kDa subunit n=1 Tax=Lupinus albus TaxID=3870 RepID=A0A6A4Q2W3_LUPAL|nr:putative transcription initiation factor TFIID, 23-30kDa subunit [Lupinus albus]